MTVTTRALRSAILPLCLVAAFGCSGGDDATAASRADADGAGGPDATESVDGSTTDGTRDPEAGSDAPDTGVEGSGDADDGHGHSHGAEDGDPGDEPAPDATAPWRTAPRGELPEGFPDSVPLPESHTVVVATSSGGDGPRSFVVQVRVQGSPRSALEALTPRFVLTGWDEVQRPDGDAAEGEPLSAVFSREGLLVSVGAIAGAGGTNVTYSVVADPVG